MSGKGLPLTWAGFWLAIGMVGMAMQAAAQESDYWAQAAAQMDEQNRQTQEMWRSQQEQMDLLRRNSEAAAQQDEEAYDTSDTGSYAPNSFVSFPPQAWNNFAAHLLETHNQEIEDSFGKDPAYRDLLRGVWTFSRSSPDAAQKTCAATFWTRNGGVTLFHFGGANDLTMLGFFGTGIPAAKRPKIVTMDLTQSGETQRVRALNMHFGAVKAMGMALFNVNTPAILIGAIEDKQDFQIRMNGATIAQGAWHSGLKARNELAACLKSQGYLAKK